MMLKKAIQNLSEEAYNKAMKPRRDRQPRPANEGAHPVVHLCVEGTMKQEVVHAFQQGTTMLPRTIPVLRAPTLQIVPHTQFPMEAAPSQVPKLRGDPDRIQKMQTHPKIPTWAVPERQRPLEMGQQNPIVKEFPWQSPDLPHSQTPPTNYLQNQGSVSRKMSMRCAKILHLPSPVSHSWKKG
ncbi:unnamed protein product [Ranitomeya imitator]|uniref:Uncharacterized protein n=1 Tax=Ranitomeya imitator TaxID=111125 RepID=A0ABN9MFS3_9NEOB|nr:unnamed protein product [Ranitomeya imitator]